jgi:hypothetical protein
LRQQIIVTIGVPISGARLWTPKQVRKSGNGLAFCGLRLAGLAFADIDHSGIVRRATN